MSNVELSPERIGTLTASRIGKIFGLSPYGDGDTVMREMIRQVHGAPEEFGGNWAAERGEELEPAALRIYEQRRTLMIWGRQQFVRHPEVPWLGATLDGRVGGDGLVEAKCPPPNARYTRVDERPDYEAQVRLQIVCTGAKWADLAVYKPDRAFPDEDQPERLFISRTLHDPAWLPSVLKTLSAFHEKFRRIAASDKLSAPFLTDLSEKPVDPFFSQAEVEYAEALATLKAAEAEVEARKKHLVEQAKGKTTRGRYYQVTYANRAGSVDYKAALAHYSGDAVDLAPFRKQSTTVVSINPVGAKSPKGK